MRAVLPEPPSNELATGLQFPEGPIAMPDGSTLLVEIARGTVSRVPAGGGAVEVVADCGGGPNGIAIGPDGAVYVCNNGGFLWSDIRGMRIPIDLATHSNEPPEFTTGSIQRIDLASGAVTTLYDSYEGERLNSPNDIVFDAHGGFWFSDLGKTRQRDLDRGGLFYATPDGSTIRRISRSLYGANGVGLSPAGDRVYVAESFTGRLLAWDVTRPGEVASPQPTVICATPGPFDSMAVEATGHVVVAAISHGLCVIDPVTGGWHDVPMPDPFVTNVCFGGPDRRTAFVTLSGTGRLVSCPWPRPGLELAFP